MKLYRVILPVTDITQAVTFYTIILDRQGIAVSPGRFYFNLGGTILAIYDPVADGDEFNDGWKHHENQYLYFAVENLERVHKTLLTSNCKYVDKSIQLMPWGERLVYAQDPFGNPICFVDEKTVFTGE